MKIEFAHLREQSTTGRMVDFAVFHGKPIHNTPSGRDALLTQLTSAARRTGRKIDVASLVYEEKGEIRTWGHPFVIDFLSKVGVPAATHSIDV